MFKSTDLFLSSIVDLTFRIKAKRDIFDLVSDIGQKYLAKEYEVSIKEEILTKYKKNFRTTFKEFEDLLTFKTIENPTKYEKLIKQNQGIYNYIKNTLMKFQKTRNLIQKFILSNNIVQFIKFLLEEKNIEVNKENITLIMYYMFQKKRSKFIDFS